MMRVLHPMFWPALSNGGNAIGWECHVPEEDIPSPRHSHPEDSLGCRVKRQLDILTGSHPFRPGIVTPQSISLPISLLRGPAFTPTQGFSFFLPPPPPALNQYCTVVWTQAQKDLLLHGDPRPVNARALVFHIPAACFSLDGNAKMGMCWQNTKTWTCSRNHPTVLRIKQVERKEIHNSG